MRKRFIVFFVLACAVMLASVGNAQNNSQAIWGIDSDLATVGFQGGRYVNEIGASKDIGFAVYVKNVDALFGYKIDITWDGTKAAFRSGDSGTEIFEDTVSINGADNVALTAESNILGSSLLAVGEVKETGRYYNGYAKMGGDAVVSSEYGLIYFCVLRTVATFTTDDSFAVSVKVTAANKDAVEKDLGERKFYVYGSSVEVKSSSWGEIKKQYKDF